MKLHRSTPKGPWRQETAHPEVGSGFSLSSLGGRRGPGRGGPSTLQGFPSPQPSPGPTGRGRSRLRTTAQPSTSGCTGHERSSISAAQTFHLPSRRLAAGGGLACRVASNRGRASAFTLVEVILAISLAIGILVAALYFHSQATNLRGQLLDESDRIAAIRLVMDRLTSELRHALARPHHGFTGGATSLEFITIEPPGRASRTANPSSSRGAVPRTDLKLVTYGLGTTLEGTNEVITGLLRAEQPLVAKPRSRSSPATPAVAESTNAPARGLEPMTEAIRFLRLRYWNGSDWSTTWDYYPLPRGIEITLGATPLPEEAPIEDYPGDLFRRVIYLPASREFDGTLDAFGSMGPASSTTALETPATSDQAGGLKR